MACFVTHGARLGAPRGTHGSPLSRRSAAAPRRAGRLAVRAAASQEEVDILTKEDLVKYIASGCKPKDQWRIGTEHEKLVYKLGSLEPAGYPEIKSLLNGLRERFDWEPIMEGENIIGVKLNGQSVTLEPGGQFELSGAPLETLHATCAEVNSHLYQVKSIAEEMDVGFLGLGFQPKWGVADTPVMPKGRYEIMRKYMPTVGSMGLDMMFRTTTIQVNLDYGSEADMVEKFQVGIALQPICTALFANSPFKDGQPNGMLSYRSFVWTDTDNARTGDLPWVFDDGMSFERYVDWVLDVPMYFVYRDGTYLNATGMSFKDWMTGKLPLLPGTYPTLADWEQHLSTVFPEVRMKKFLEMRGADGGPFKRICALPAFWVGLLYDDQAQKEALALVKDWTAEERSQLKLGVSIQGLRTPFRGGTVCDVAKQVLDISKGGLERRGLKEESFLNDLFEMVESGNTSADLLLAKFHGEWEGNIDRVYNDMMY